MITIIAGVAISLLTEGTKLLKKWFPNISIRVVVVLLSLLAGVIYYYFEQNNPMIIENVIKFTSGAFATSQAIWMILDKFLAVEDLSE